MNKDGFLLIELLVALSLFTIFVFIITKFQAISLSNFELASHKLHALNLALELEFENDAVQDNKIYTIDVKKITYGRQINNIFLLLKNSLGPNLIFKPKEFIVYEITVRFKLLKGNNSEVNIKSSVFSS